MCEFDKPDKTFAPDLYLIYKRSSSAGVYICRYRLAAHILYILSDTFLKIQQLKSNVNKI